MGPDAGRHLQEVAGYLNYSSGSADPRFLRGINHLFEEISHSANFPIRCRRGLPARFRPGGPWAWSLGRVYSSSRRPRRPFRQVEQAEAVMRIVFDDFLPAYRRHHRDLLFHQTEESLFQPLFIGRAFEAVLSEGGPWEETERIVVGAMKRLNDYLGHRPVPVLRTAQKIQPYAHERVRPIPLYVAGAGVAVGRYHDLIEKTLEMLRSTDPDLLRQSWFDPEVLSELSLDPRALDFDHPVNRRPNHHFGGWDPHQIDNQGRYRRFVLQQVTLDALWQRVESRGEIPYEEMLFEAAAVLAGTMLMGSGISGSGPDTHDSTVTIAKLLPVIAGYRDAFYERLRRRLRGSAGRAAAERGPGPAAAARRCAAAPQPDAGPAASGAVAARPPGQAFRQDGLYGGRDPPGPCRAGRLGTDALPDRLPPDGRPPGRRSRPAGRGGAFAAGDRGPLAAGHRVRGIGRPLEHPRFRRAIQPLPGDRKFQFTDHRVDELIELISEVFNLYARLEKEAAAAGRAELQLRLSSQMEVRARWWDQFATTEVGGVEGFSGQQMWESAAQVAEVLAAWHQAGTAAGDIGFWREHVERFGSPRGFALLAESLLDLGDLVAAMGLLTYWLSRAEEIPLAEGNHSFHLLALGWMEELWSPGAPSASSTASATPATSTLANRADPPRAIDSTDRWPLTRKFLDYLEANADEYWQVPSLELTRQAADEQVDDEEDDEESAEDDRGGLFSAAYDEVTYRDTTDDGFEGEILDGGQPITDFELTAETERIGERLAFLGTLARLWKRAAAAAGAERLPAVRREVLSGWLARAVENRRQLLKLLGAVHRYRIPEPRCDHDSLVEYSQRQGIKELLLERVIAACVETADAARRLAGALGGGESAELDAWEMPAERVLESARRGDVAAVRRAWPHLLALLRRQPLLYIPTSRGGSPNRVVASRGLQRTLGRLLAAAPRLGLLAETYKLIVAIQEMEQGHPVGPGPSPSSTVSSPSAAKGSSSASSSLRSVGEKSRRARSPAAVAPSGS